MIFVVDIPADDTVFDDDVTVMTVMTALLILSMSCGDDVGT
jgi:hypothetical protein